MTCCIGAACYLQVRLFVDAGFNCQGTEPLHSVFNEAIHVTVTISLVTVVAIAVPHGAVMFAALFKSLARSLSRRSSREASISPSLHDADGALLYYDVSLPATRFFSL